MHYFYLISVSSCLRHSFDERKRDCVWYAIPLSVLHALIIFLFAVHAPVSFGLLICQIENIWKLLLDGSDAAWVFAADHIGDLLRQF